MNLRSRDSNDSFALGSERLRSFVHATDIRSLMMARLALASQRPMQILCPTATRKFPHRSKSITWLKTFVAVVANYAAQGCQILVAPFDIMIGKCAVLQDPFGSRLCILDMTKRARLLNLVQR
jgi:hypothetical protein